MLSRKPTEVSDHAFCNTRIVLWVGGWIPEYLSVYVYTLCTECYTTYDTLPV